MIQRLPKKLAAHWDELIHRGKTLFFKKGQVLVYGGHSPYGLFVLKSGKVRFTEEDHQHKDPCKGKHLISIPEGELIGLEDFFSDTPFCCSCTATTECRVVFIPKTLLLPFKGEYNPRFTA